MAFPHIGLCVITCFYGAVRTGEGGVLTHPSCQHWSLTLEGSSAPLAGPTGNPILQKLENLLYQMVKTDLCCSLFQLTGFVAFAISELLSCGMALVASCQTHTRSWRVSHCRHLVYFSWHGEKPVSVGAESAVPGNPCFLGLLQPEVHRWSGSCSVAVASALQSSTF